MTVPVLQRELRVAPAPVMEPFVAILADLRRFAADNSSPEQVAALLWGIHAAALLEAHAVVTLEAQLNGDGGRGDDIAGDGHAAVQLREGLLALRIELRVHVQPLLLGLLARAPIGDSSSLASAAAIHAHVLLIWASAARLRDICAPSAPFTTRSTRDKTPAEACGLSRVLASAVYIAQWARPTATDAAAAPWQHAFNVALEAWGHVLEWLSGRWDDAFNNVLSCAMAVAMRLPPGQVREYMRMI